MSGTGAIREPQDDLGLQELRAEALDLLGLGLVGLAIGLLFLAAVDAETRRPGLWLVVGGLLLTAVAGQAWRWSLPLASGLVVLGLGLSVVAGTVVYPGSQALYALPLVVGVTGALFGLLPTCLVAALGSLGVLLLAQDGRGWVEAPGMVVGLLWAAAVITWLVTRPTRIALDWAWQHYRLAQQRTEELRQRQGELGRLAKSLDEACARLEAMNWELERARRAAEEARRLKAEFAAAVSHELRTPLNLIIGFAEMMMHAPQAYGGTGLPEPYRQDLEAIYRNACHLSRLIDDVLDLSQIEAHRLALERRVVSLRQIVDEAVATVATLYERLGLWLQVDLSPDLPLLFVDPNRIRQILINLLNNAARFTERGGVTIRATSDGREVVVAVSDTGTGIAPEDLPYVFQEFYQAGPPGRRRGGSGLGLAICKRFAEMHGGYMWAESQVGQGSTFYLALPLCGNVATEPLVRTPAPRPTTERTVVVLAREPEAARVFQRYLDGYTVVWAGSERDLRRLAASRPVQAVVITEPEAQREPPAWAGDPRLREIPVFHCPLSTPQHLARELGVQAYLVKPVNPERLTTVLRRLGRRRREILIVEDDPEMARLLTEILTTTWRRVRVRTAADGAEALRLLRERWPDLLLLDLLMPGMSGYEVLRTLRADPALRDLPVVVLTARGAEETPVRAQVLSLSCARGLTVAEMVACLRHSLEALTASRPSAPETASPAA